MGLLISFIKILITLFRVIFFAFFLGGKADEIPAVMRFFNIYAANARKRFPEILQESNFRA
ncbi:hypothetical protein ASG81_14135 [Paenibacillus sp. Soil522]|nr:hypothetical protein ASG81_14135 [Paenibacillus sp. Soil522]